MYRRRLEKCKIWGEQVCCTGEPPIISTNSTTTTKSRTLGDPSDLECIDDEDIPFLNDMYHKRTPFTPKRRCYLLGSAAMNIPLVAQTTIKLTKDAFNNEKTKMITSTKEETNNTVGIIFNDAPNSFRLKHNFNPTYCVCEILPLKSIQDCESLEIEISKLETEAKSYAIEDALAIENGRVPDHSTHAYMPSILSKLPQYNEVVKLQQTLMRLSAISSIEAGGKIPNHVGKNMSNEFEDFVKSSRALCGDDKAMMKV